MVCWYEVATTISSPAMASATGIARDTAPAPASTRTRRISSVAYAVEESASEAKTASAVFLERRSWRARESGIGRPTTRRLKRLAPIALQLRLAAEHR